jgi:hypothetical protein
MKKSKRGTAPLPNQQLFKEVKKKEEVKKNATETEEAKPVPETETKEENNEINKEDDKDGNVQNG